jgi:hypothetical protein
MKKIILGFFVLGFVGGVQAQQSSCMATATEKKLAGAAKASFLKKCEKDARATCEMDDMSKKLNGAAKQSHVKKCVKDAVGS